MSIQHIVSFSGGKDSTAMLLMMIEKKYPLDRVIFVDTTKEFPPMYHHIQKVQQVCPVEIEVVSFDFDYFFSEHIKTKINGKNHRGYGFPTIKSRWCTALKRDTYLKQVRTKAKKGTQIIEYIGIAYDEQRRLNRNNGNRMIKYPLVEWEITEKQALQYCYAHGFDWSGLYRFCKHVSCWCCPFQSMNQLRYIFREWPGLWEKILEMESKSSYRFKHLYSAYELDRRFRNEHQQLALFEFA